MKKYYQFIFEENEESVQNDDSFNDSFETLSNSLKDFWVRTKVSTKPKEVQKPEKTTEPSVSPTTTSVSSTTTTTTTTTTITPKKSLDPKVVKQIDRIMTGTESTKQLNDMLRNPHYRDYVPYIQNKLNQREAIKALINLKFSKSDSKKYVEMAAEKNPNMALNALVKASLKLADPSKKIIKTS